MLCLEINPFSCDYVNVGLFSEMHMLYAFNHSGTGFTVRWEIRI